MYQTLSFLQYSFDGDMNLAHDNLTMYPVNLPEHCPRCGFPAFSHPVHPFSVIDDGSIANFTVPLVCPRCKQTFIAGYTSSNAEPAFLAPDDPPSRPFSPAIKEISPEFDRLYNQALAADFMQYEDLAGMGYRKAAEILVKDYLIRLHPESQEAIISKQLSDCITSFVDNENIKILASRVAWLGNDYAHYLDKHPEYSIEDLKRLIDGLINLIDLEALTLEAKQIPKR